LKNFTNTTLSFVVTVQSKISILTLGILKAHQWITQATGGQKRNSINYYTKVIPLTQNHSQSLLDTWE
jgi:hypothetical protein